MEYCVKCGTSLPENMAFCVACGTRVAPLPASPFITPVRTEKSANTFLNTGLGFVLMGALLLLIIGTGLFLSNFYDSRNLINVFRQFAVFASISFSAALTVRAKGPDLSIGSVVGLSAVLIAWFSVMTGSVYTRLIIALIISSIIGLINGVCAVYLRVPAIVISIVTGSIATGIGYLLSNGQPIMGSFTDFAVLTVGGVPLGALILLCITFIPAFLLVLLTRLGIPTYKRDPAARPFLMWRLTLSVLPLLRLPDSFCSPGLVRRSRRSAQDMNSTYFLLLRVFI